MKVRIVLTGFILTLALATTAWADGVIRVVRVETDDVDAYIAQIERGREILDRLDSSGTIRVLVAGYAGESAGDVVVTVEYPSMVALAEDEAKIMADEGYTSWLAGLEEIRTIVSDSIYRDITP